MTDGNWRLGVLIDEAASDDQAEKLGGVFSGGLGGPMAALAPLIGENLGVERVPMEFSSDGGRHSVSLGDKGRVEVGVVLLGVETGEPARLVGIFHPVGSELTISSRELEGERVRHRAYAGGPVWLLDGVRLVGLTAMTALRSLSARLEAGPFVGWRLSTVGALVVLAIAAWAITGVRMEGMDAGPGTELGTLGFYVTSSVVMMAAMMAPSVAPLVAIYAGLQHGRHAKSMPAPAGATSS